MKKVYRIVLLMVILLFVTFAIDQQIAKINHIYEGWFVTDEGQNVQVSVTIDASRKNSNFSKNKIGINYAETTIEAVINLPRIKSDAGSKIIYLDNEHALDQVLGKLYFEKNKKIKIILNEGIEIHANQK